MATRGGTKTDPEDERRSSASPDELKAQHPELDRELDEKLPTLEAEVARKRSRDGKALGRSDETITSRARESTEPTGTKTARTETAEKSAPAATAGGSARQTAKDDKPERDNKPEPSRPSGRRERGFNRALSFVTSHRRWFLGAGGVGLAGSIIGFFFYLAPLQLFTLVENMFSHHFRRANLSYDRRERLAFKYYLKERFDPTFNKDGAIVDYERSIWKNIFAKFRDSDLEDRLATKGYKFEYKCPPGSGNCGKNNSQGILRIRSPEGGTLNGGGAFDREYNLMFEKFDARSDVQVILRDSYQGAGWFKRISSFRRARNVLHVSFHPFDVITQPINKARLAVRNQILDLTLKNDLYRSFAVRMVEFFFGAGSKASQQSAQVTDDFINKATASNATKEATKPVVKAISDEVLKSSLGRIFGIAGLSLMATQVICTVNNVFENGAAELSKIARDKAQFEYGVVATQALAGVSQLKTGRTDATAVALHMELLTDSQGRGIQNRNLQRASGQNVAYTPTDDCESGTEVCLADQPDNAATATGLFSFLKGTERITSNPLNKTLGSLFPGMPGAYLTDATCAIYREANNVILGPLANALDSILRAIPGIGGIYAGISDDFGQFLADHLTLPFFNHLFVPKADADTRGPKYTNAVAEGMDYMNSSQLRSMCGDVNTEEKCKLNQAQIAQLNASAVANEVALSQGLPWWERVTSLDRPGSAASILVLNAPATPAALAYQLTSMPIKMAQLDWVNVIKSSLAATFSTPVHADNGLADATALGTTNSQYGYPDQCLIDAPLGYAGDGSVASCKDAAGNNLSTAPLDQDAGCAMWLGVTKGEVADRSECEDQISVGGAAASESGALPGGNAAELAKQILANSKIQTPGRLVDEDLQRASNGQPGTAGVAVNEKMLAVLVSLSQEFSFNITAIQSGGTGHTATSNHFKGTGVDIQPASPDNHNAAQFAGLFKKLYDGRGTYGLDELIFSPAPGGTTTLKGGQTNRYGASTLDAHTNHIHFSVQ